MQTTLFLLPPIIATISGIIYIRYILKAHITINLSTWLIRLFIEIINITSYINIVEDPIKGLIPLSSGIIILMTIIIGLYKGQLKKLDKFDIGMLGLGILTIIILIISKSYIVTNLLLQLAFAIGYIPTILGVYRGQLKERHLPRTIGALSAITGLVLLIIYYESRYILAYSIIWILGNSAIIRAILHHKKKHKYKKLP